MFHESDTDFDLLWYNDNGFAITKAMMINALINPMVEMGMGAKRKFFRWYDLRGDKETRQTKEKDYIDIHAGPQYPMHAKYAFILLTVFMTQLFGLGLPILYPIALIGFIIFYYTEMYMLHYSYRSPPCYDEKLNQKILYSLEFSPIVCNIMSVWQISNR